jgi:hypothetical protein
MTIGYGYLIVVTNTQCHLYNITTANSINTPYKFDLKDKVRLILTCPKYFALIDDNNGLNVNNILSRSIHMKVSNYKVPTSQELEYPLLLKRQ